MWTKKYAEIEIKFIMIISLVQDLIENLVGSILMNAAEQL